MARAIEPFLGRHLDDGLVIVKYGHGLATKHIAVAEARHPLPDRAGLTRHRTHRPRFVDRAALRRCFELDARAGRRPEAQ
jgi:glycerate-2-kinase